MKQQIQPYLLTGPGWNSWLYRSRLQFYGWRAWGEHAETNTVLVAKLNDDATSLATVHSMFSLARPRAHGTMKVGRKSKYTLGAFKAHLRSVALGRTQAEGPQEILQEACTSPQA